MNLINNKYDRIHQLIKILESHPEGLRKSDIARRLGVHRSTVGRYIDDLSLSLPIWERGGLVGVESERMRDIEPHFDIFEGAFLLSLIRLYQQEINIKNPHASSVMRKLSSAFQVSSPVLAKSMLEAAENLDQEDTLYADGYVENFEKLSIGWSRGESVKTRYMHMSTGESCETIFEPKRFFTVKAGSQKSELAVQGFCRRFGGYCSLGIGDFSQIEYPVTDIDFEEGYQNLFCPVSEYALTNLPVANDNPVENLNIKESNHRIKNSLFMAAGLINITFADEENEEIQHKSRQLQSRIDTIALLHDQLSSSRGSDIVDLEQFLRGIIEKTILIASLDPDNLKIKLKMKPVKIRNSKALPLGMILSELLINSFKYAVKDDSFVLKISVKGESGIIQVRYSDGSGYRMVKEEGHSGTELIDNFCKQLNCSIKYENNYLILEFPV